MKITVCYENNDKFHLPREISRTGYLKIYHVIVSVAHSRNFDDLLCEITVLHQGLEGIGGGGVLIPNSRSFFTRILNPALFSLLSRTGCTGCGVTGSGRVFSGSGI